MGAERDAGQDLGVITVWEPGAVAGGAALVSLARESLKEDFVFAEFQRPRWAFCKTRHKEGPPEQDRWGWGSPAGVGLGRDRTERLWGQVAFAEALGR